MKLTCVLIVAVLFLTACQLITADDSSDLQEFPRRKMIDRLLDTKAAQERCLGGSSPCTAFSGNCCNYCAFFWCT
uniref:Conotoxin n=1 Tax=Conus andremenezi TaxID=1077466 RepID=A0A291C210_9COND|nr:conotoxin [Conus andremenezi]